MDRPLKHEGEWHCSAVVELVVIYAKINLGVMFRAMFPIVFLRFDELCGDFFILGKKFISGFQSI